MKKRILCWIMTVALVFSCTPMALAADDAPADGYNDHDFNQLLEFLEQPSATAGQSNGRALNADYAFNDPTTWTGVTWSTYAEKRVIEINFDSFGLAGALDVSGLADMIYLYCGSNELTSLDVSDSIKLRWLSCNSNELTTLDVSGCTALATLDCGYNALTSLTVSGCSVLTSLQCRGNELTTLDVSGLTMLEYLYCDSNALTSLDVSDLIKLKWLNCSHNALTSLDVSGLTTLIYLACGKNTLTTLDVAGLTVLEYLFCCENALTSLDVSGLTVLEYLDCSSNALTTQDVSGLAALEVLDCSSNALASLDVSDLIKLGWLGCDHNALTTLTVSGCTALTYLGCGYNALTTLTVSGCSALQGLYCSNNLLTSLNVSACAALTSLYCNSNALTTLTVSGCTKLTSLDCDSNALTSLDVSLITDTFSDPHIYTLNNPLTQINLSMNGTSMRLRAAGGGYVVMYGNGDYNIFIATPQASARFVNWTAADGSQVAATAIIPFTYDTAYNLTANFASASAATLVPVGLSCAVTNATTDGGANGSITVTASGGNSGTYDYLLDGGGWQTSNVFGGLAAGTYTAVVRDAVYASNIAAMNVTVSVSIGGVAAKKLPAKPNAGTALTIVPPAAPKGYTVVSVTYSSSNPFVAAVDGSGNVTFIAGGKATIITKVVSQMTDKKGKLKTKTTTVKKSVTVQQPVASISLSAADATIARKAKLKLTANVAPSTASNKKLTWKSSNPKVASVSSSGVVTGKAGGTAVITCTAKDGSGASASCTVTVTPIYPTGIKLNKAALTLKLGKGSSLKATVLPKTTDFKAVTWASSNPAVVSVDAKGKVTALASGTAVITATASTGLSATCTVTVP